MKQGKIIVRNLIFDMREKHLQTAFKKFGTIVEVNVPLDVAKNQNRGFAFLEFETREMASNAISAMNGSKFKGRNLTVEFSVPKVDYEKRIDNIVANTGMEKADALKPTGVKADARTVVKEEKKVKDDAAEVEANKTKTQLRKDKREKQAKDAVTAAATKKKEEEKAARPAPIRDQTTDATLFVRNVGWDTDEAEFKDFMETFGPTKYAVLCKTRGDLMEETGE